MLDPKSFMDMQISNQPILWKPGKADMHANTGEAISTSKIGEKILSDFDNAIVF